jgi:O-antigen/teichoic acid export membrane protein
MGLNLAIIPQTLGENIRKGRELLRFRELPKLFRIQRDRSKERYRRAALTGAASIIQRGLTVLISLVSVPLTIHYLGPERYGVWLTISSLLVWLAITDFGLAGNALINVLSEAHGHDDKRTAQQYVASAIWSLTVIAAVLGLITLFCFPHISWPAVFRSTSIPHGELAAAAGLTLGFFLISLPLSIQYAVYSGYQDGALSNACGIMMNVSSLIALVVVTQFKGGLPALVLALSGTRLLIGFGNTIYIFKRYPWLLPIPSAIRWHCIRKLLSLGSKYFVSQLGSFGIGQSQPLIITQILGPAAVVPFVLTHRLITLPMEVAYLSLAPLVPAFGEAKARYDWQWIRNAFRRTTVMSIALGIPLVFLLGIIAKPVIRIWAGPAAVPGWTLIIGLILYNIIGVMFMGTGQLLTGVERVTPLVVSTSLCAVCTIGFGVLGCTLMGIAGVALAMAGSKLLTFWPIQVLAVRKLFRSEPFEPPVPDIVVNEEVA